MIGDGVQSYFCILPVIVKNILQLQVKSSCELVYSVLFKNLNNQMFDNSLLINTTDR